MKTLLTVIAVACFIFTGSVWPQSENSERVSRENNAGHTQPANKPDSNQQKSSDSAPIKNVQPIPTDQRDTQYFDNSKHQPEKNGDSDSGLVTVTIWLAIAGFIQAVILAVQAVLFFQQKKIMGQHKTSLEQLAGAAAANADISAKTLVLTQRPRIVVRAFYFSEIRGVGGITHVSNRIEAGSFCTGQYYIENCGGTDARIREIYSEVYIAESLPMMRPYEGKEGSKEEKTLRPGTSTFYLFGRMEPLDDSTAQALNVRREIIAARPKNFYVLGWIGYTDDLGIYRMTAFCRRYDATKDRFVPVDDPDYEYAD